VTVLPAGVQAIEYVTPVTGLVAAIIRSCPEASIGPYARLTSSANAQLVTGVPMAEPDSVPAGP